MCETGFAEYAKRQNLPSGLDGTYGEKYMDSVTAIAFRAWQAAQAMQWQPIETAPKTGEDILVYAVKEQFVAFWHERLNRFVFAMGEDKTFMIGTPQYWMPLPPPPNTPCPTALQSAD